LAGERDPVLADHDEFPYRIRVISDMLGIERFQLDGERLRRNVG